MKLDSTNSCTKPCPTTPSSSPPPVEHAVIPRILPFVLCTTVGPVAILTFDVSVEVSFSGDYKNVGISTKRITESYFKAICFRFT